MPESVVHELWMLIPTAVYFVVGVALFGISIWLMNRFSPFPFRKEIEEDQNIAVAIIIGSVLIGLAIILSSVIK